MAVSDITNADIINYLNLDSDNITAEDTRFLDQCKSIATEYILDYTGVDDINSKEAFSIVYLVLIQDMWDNRTLYPDSTEVNDLIANILGMHSINLL